MSQLPKGNATKPSAGRSGRVSADYLILPRGGDGLPAPEPPLATSFSELELAIWVDLWSKPQAAAWRFLEGIENTVARYVRFLVLSQAEQKTNDEGKPIGKHPVDFAQPLLKLEEDLGLTPRGLQRWRWTIAGEGEESNVERHFGVEADEKPKGKKKSDAAERRRLRAV